jgi:hypothetical protein
MPEISTGQPQSQPPLRRRGAPMRILTAGADLPGRRRLRIAMAGPSFCGTGTRGSLATLSSKGGYRCLTDRASAAATWPLDHNPTFLRPEASVSCMRLLGRSVPTELSWPVLILCRKQQVLLRTCIFVNRFLWLLAAVASDQRAGMGVYIRQLQHPAMM